MEQGVGAGGSDARTWAEELTTEGRSLVEQGEVNQTVADEDEGGRGREHEPDLLNVN